MKEKIIIIGAGQMGELVSNIILRQNMFSILGFIDKKKNNKKINGFNILGNDNFLNNKKIKCKNVVVAIADIDIRNKIYKKLKKLGFNFPNIIDPTAIIDKNVNITYGNIISMNSVILNKAKINKFCIVGTSVTILHDTTIGENCVIGGGTLIGANNTFENNIFVGVGSVFASRKINIGKNSFVSSGSVVLNSIKKYSKVIGNPAKVIGKNQ